MRPFEFHKVYRALYDFATTDLSAVYFDVLKDRLYTAATNSRARRSGRRRCIACIML
ncbi:MAG: class I tRNA ligase family protein [Acidobacteriota bacterium]